MLIVVVISRDVGQFDQCGLLTADEQEIAAVKGTKKEAASGYKTECGRSWYGQILVRLNTGWIRSSGKRVTTCRPDVNSSSFYGIYVPIIEI